MRRVLFVALLAAVSLSLVGCKKKPRQDLAEVPPPTGSQAPSTQSIYVGPPAPSGSSDIYQSPEPSDGYVSSSSTATIGSTSLYESPSSGSTTFTTPPAPAPTYTPPAADAGVPTYTIPVPDTGSGGNYTVQRGDTLWSIAQRVYGSGQRWKDIAAANNIGNERKLRIGQQLIIP